MCNFLPSSVISDLIVFCPWFRACSSISNVVIECVWIRYSIDCVLPFYIVDTECGQIVHSVELYTDGVSFCYPTSN